MSQLWQVRLVVSSEAVVHIHLKALQAPLLITEPSWFWRCGADEHHGLNKS